MKLRLPALTLLFAVAQGVSLAACTGVLLDAADRYHAAGDHTVVVLNAIWLVLLFPLGFVGELIPHSDASPVLGYGLFVANALLWGWCIARFLPFVVGRCSRPSFARP